MDRKRILLIATGITIAVVLAGALLLFFRARATPSEPAPVPSAEVTLDTLTDESATAISSSSAQISLRAGTGSLYTSSTASGEAVAREFIRRGQSAEGGALFPQGIDTEVRKIRSAGDGEGTVRPKNPTEHHYYRQEINGVPVYGGTISVHIRNGNEVYATEARTVTDRSVLPATIDASSAASIALKRAREEEPALDPILIGSTDWIVNTALLGLNERDENHPAVAVSVGSADFAVPFAATYLVSLADGSVLTVEPEVHEARNREVLNGRACADPQNPATCKILRTETGPPTGDAESDRIFDRVGDIYEYYRSRYGWDSFDGRGSTIRIMPKFPGKSVANGQSPNDCRNAFWYQDYHMLAICEGMGADDVVMHEFAHGVTISSSGLKFVAQSGAMNEGVSDLMSTGIDDDWSIGEDSRLGVIRTMDDPTLKNHPDRLFAGQYACPATQQCIAQNDYCGVHTNSGVLNKTGYLMAQGGTFNGCTIEGIGKDRMQAIVHRATTVYLNELSNYRDMANALGSACDDLYEGDVCEQVTGAIRATEMDQQPLGSQVSPRCTGGKRKEPACAPAGTSPTGGTTPSPGPSRPVTGSPTASTSRTPTTVASRAPSVPTTKPTQTTTTGCVPKYRPDRNGCEQPTLHMPKASTIQGPVTFSWCTSTPQAGYFFRLDYNANDPLKPEVVQDRIRATTVTVTVPLGTHSWWVHSFCQDGGDGYLSKASGQQLSTVRQNSSGTAPSSTPVVPTSAGGQSQGSIGGRERQRQGGGLVTATPTQAPAGTSQMFLRID